MRRGIGVQGIQRQKMIDKKFSDKGDELAEAQLAQMKEMFKTFQDSLEEFALKYKKQISKNPEFRQYFNEMCQKIGVDPLASQRGFWAQVLGVGDFYYELGVQVVEVCLRTRPSNGGIIEINELKTRVTKMRGKKSQEISIDDIERAIKKLKILGCGFNVINVGRKKMVQSVPCELSNDHTTVMVLAQDTAFVTASTIKKELLWDEVRIKTVVDLLVKEGMAWVDDQYTNPSLGGAQERAYWFPALANFAFDIADDQ